MIKLRYGNTNTYFLNGLLIDTDMPDTLPSFFRELKKNGLSTGDIRYVLSTHYHPDHMGLNSALTELGITLLLPDRQKDFVHFSDAVFKRQKNLGYQPIHESDAAVITLGESRSFLAGLGIHGEILPTESHSPDGIALITDDGECFAGDLEPMQYIDAYEENTPLRSDWDRILCHHPKTVYFGHINCQMYFA